ncbi:MAG: hypothetical protein N3G77_06080 [Nitrososphaeria archaeon]|nr:hypothetical protein [Nitrososphaeria archaeon]MDW7985887.1 hypothetical protein [Nitrososphaerota archaeon]
MKLVYKPTSSLIFYLSIIIFLIFFYITVYEAYSVYISLQESSIQPLPERTSIKYFFSKAGGSSVWAEIRSISLSTSGTTVTSTTVTWYRRFPSVWGYYVTVRITLRDNNGYQISSGSVSACYIGSGSVTSNIDLIPDVNIDEVAGVESSVIIGSICWEPPWSTQTFDVFTESEVDEV